MKTQGKKERWQLGETTSVSFYLVVVLAGLENINA
jgi:hypothetical protein